MNLYHGGGLDGPQSGCEGLWVTDDLDAARDYAATNGTETIHRIAVPDGARIITLAEAAELAGDPEIVPRVTGGQPQYISFLGPAQLLADAGVWAVHVPHGDEHPDTGRIHASWWIVGAYETTEVER